MTGDSAGFRVELPALIEAVDVLGKFRDEFTGMISDCEHTVMALGSDWSGDARDAQLAFFRRLADGMRTVDEGLHEFRTGIQDAHDGYKRALDANTAMWGG